MKNYLLVKYLYLVFWLALLTVVGMYHFGLDDKVFSSVTLFLLCDLGLVLLAANVKLHRQALASGLAVNSMGLKATVLSCLFLTPLEAVIVLPAINLLRLKGLSMERAAT